MIRAEELYVRYGSETALESVNLSIPQYTNCAIIGPSGCGKTTLIHVLAGLIRPDSGRVYIKGRELHGVRKGTGVILQNLGLLPWETLWQNVALGLKAEKDSRETVKHKVLSAINEFGIFDHCNKYPSQLSGGQKQRAAIARAIVSGPDLLLLDEAASALDEITREHFQELIIQLHKRMAVTIVLVTHSIEEAVFIGQRIIVMKKAGIKEIVDNPYYGDLSRKGDGYFNMCRKVRSILDESNV